MEDFYVYQYLRLDNNTPFYVGKVRKHRARNVCAQRTPEEKRAIALKIWEKRRLGAGLL